MKKILISLIIFGGSCLFPLMTSASENEMIGRKADNVSEADNDEDEYCQDSVVDGSASPDLLMQKAQDNTEGDLIDQEDASADNGKVSSKKEEDSDKLTTESTDSAASTRDPSEEEEVPEHFSEDKENTPEADDDQEEAAETTEVQMDPVEEQTDDLKMQEGNSEEGTYFYIDPDNNAAEIDPGLLCFVTEHKDTGDTAEVTPKDETTANVSASGSEALTLYISGSEDDHVCFVEGWKDLSWYKELDESVKISTLSIRFQEAEYDTFYKCWENKADVYAILSVVDGAGVSHELRVPVNSIKRNGSIPINNEFPFSDIIKVPVILAEEYKEEAEETYTGTTPYQAEGYDDSLVEKMILYISGTRDNCICMLEGVLHFCKKAINREGFGDMAADSLFIRLGENEYNTIYECWENGTELNTIDNISIHNIPIMLYNASEEPDHNGSFPIDNRVGFAEINIDPKDEDSKENNEDSDEEKTDKDAGTDEEEAEDFMYESDEEGTDWEDPHHILGQLRLSVAGSQGEHFFFLHGWDMWGWYQRRLQRAAIKHLTVRFIEDVFHSFYLDDYVFAHTFHMQNEDDTFEEAWKDKVRGYDDLGETVERTLSVVVSATDVEGVDHTTIVPVDLNVWSEIWDSSDFYTKVDYINEPLEIDIDENGRPVKDTPDTLTLNVIGTAEKYYCFLGNSELLPFTENVDLEQIAIHFIIPEHESLDGYIWDDFQGNPSIAAVITAEDIEHGHHEIVVPVMIRHYNPEDHYLYHPENEDEFYFVSDDQHYEEGIPVNTLNRFVIVNTKQLANDYFEINRPKDTRYTDQESKAAIATKPGQSENVVYHTSGRVSEKAHIKMPGNAEGRNLFRWLIKIVYEVRNDLREQILRCSKYLSA